MDQLTVIDQIRQNADLLSLPQSLSQMLREMENPSFSSESLAKIILQDPALTAKILKLSNSSFYHRAVEVTTVNQAIQILGVTTVKCMALSTSVFSPEKFEKGTGINVVEFFTGVLTVAAASEKIAREAGMKSPDEAFIAGLLHEIGTMFFIHHYPEDYRRIVEHKVKARNLLEAEKQVFGASHAEAGYELAIRWKIPKQVCDAIAEQHSPVVTSEKPTLREVLRLACLLSNEGIEGYSLEMDSRQERIATTAGILGLSNAQIDEIASSLPGLSLEVAEHMSVDIGSVEDMMVRANQKLWRTYLTVENLFKERKELNEKILKSEREKGALESKNIAIATLSHYLNNAVMSAYGRSQLLRRQHERGEFELLCERLPQTLDVFDRSIKKIVAVVEELKNLSPDIEKIKFLNTSSAVNIDDRIEERLKQMDEGIGLVLPEEATIR